MIISTFCDQKYPVKSWKMIENLKFYFEAYEYHVNVVCGGIGHESI